MLLRLLLLTLSLFLILPKPVFGKLSDCDVLLQTYSEDTEFLVSLFAIPADKRKYSLGKRWKVLENAAKEAEWANFSSARDEIAMKKMNEINRKRMSPSNTIFENSSHSTERWEKAKNQIARWIRDGKEPNLTRLIRLNFLIAENTQDKTEGPGKIRSREWTDDFDGNNFPAFKAIETQKGLIETFQWYESVKNTIHPIELATRMYQRLITIHPFFDGNGRTIRLMMDWILISNGYPPPCFVHPNVTVHRAWDNSDVWVEEALHKVTSGIENTYSIMRLQ